MIFYFGNIWKQCLGQGSSNFHFGCFVFDKCDGLLKTLLLLAYEQGKNFVRTKERILLAEPSVFHKSVKKLFNT